MQIPAISVVVLRGRDNEEWYQECINSLNGSILPLHEIVVVENRDRAISIGAGWNLGAREATGEWVFFIGDDDFVSPEYFIALVTSYYAAIATPHNKEIITVSSYPTAFNDEDGAAFPVVGRTVTGMWKRDYLLANPFNEELTRLIDAEYVATHVKNNIVIARHSYGYFYRQHTGKTSGRLIPKYEKPLQMENEKSLQLDSETLSLQIPDEEAA